MAIAVQTIVDRINFELDAEGSDRYVFARDHMPAINAAQDWMVGLFNAVYGENKLPEENLRELTRTRIWITSNRSRFNFDYADVLEYLWSVVAIYPSISYSGLLAAQADLTKSVYCPDAIYLSSTIQTTKRFTAEEWTEKNRNPFMAGSSLLGWTEGAEYGYLNFMETDSDIDTPEIEIAPATNNTAIAMAYIAYPTPVTAIGDNVPFPMVLTDLVVNKALQFIAIKQGDDNALLYKITSQEIDMFVKFMT